MHKPVLLENICFSLPHKPCFDDFSESIPYGSRIAIIGRNGCGKSTLLKILQRILPPTSGRVLLPDDAILGYVPQIITEFESLSGGQRLNKAFTQALSCTPNILLFDEPTNHLDLNNKRSLIRMLKSFQGTLIVVSHDMEILQSCVDTLWHIDSNKINIFSGNYADYMREKQIQRSSIERELSRLSRQNKSMHLSLMKEQARAAQSRIKGKKSIEQRKWPTVVGHAKAHKASKTSGKKKSNINQKTQILRNKRVELSLPEVILPEFSLTANDLSYCNVVSISQGAIRYKEQPPTLQNISISIASGDRIAIMGDNASGKSTLIKGIMGMSEVLISGHWTVPKPQDIGYLDQHYHTLASDQTVFETIQILVPSWPYNKIRRHLGDFLFRKNEEVSAPVRLLSGGEKARLALAQIAAKTPKLLILDEVTNNLDLEAQEYMIQVLKQYPGTFMVISHDYNFLQKIGITEFLQIHNGLISRNSEP